MVFGPVSRLRMYGFCSYFESEENYLVRRSDLTLKAVPIRWHRRVKHTRKCNTYKTFYERIHESIMCGGGGCGIGRSDDNDTVFVEAGPAILVDSNTTNNNNQGSRQSKKMISNQQPTQHQEPKLYVSIVASLDIVDTSKYGPALQIISNKTVFVDDDADHPFFSGIEGSVSNGTVMTKTIPLIELECACRPSSVGASVNSFRSGYCFTVPVEEFGVALKSTTNKTVLLFEVCPTTYNNVSRDEVMYHLNALIQWSKSNTAYIKALNDNGGIPITTKTTPSLADRIVDTKENDNKEEEEDDTEHSDDGSDDDDDDDTDVINNNDKNNNKGVSLATSKELLDKPNTKTEENKEQTTEKLANKEEEEEIVAAGNNDDNGNNIEESTDATTSTEAVVTNPNDSITTNLEDKTLEGSSKNNKSVVEKLKEDLRPEDNEESGSGIGSGIDMSIGIINENSDVTEEDDLEGNNGQDSDDNEEEGGEKNGDKKSHGLIETTTPELHHDNDSNVNINNYDEDRLMINSTLPNLMDDTTTIGDENSTIRSATCTATATDVDKIMKSRGESIVASPHINDRTVAALELAMEDINNMTKSLKEISKDDDNNNNNNKVAGTTKTTTTTASTTKPNHMTNEKIGSSTTTTTTTTTTTPPPKIKKTQSLVLPSPFSGGRGSSNTTIVTGTATAGDSSVATTTTSSSSSMSSWKEHTSKVAMDVINKARIDSENKYFSTYDNSSLQQQKQQQHITTTTNDIKTRKEIDELIKKTTTVKSTPSKVNNTNVNDNVNNNIVIATRDEIEQRD